jgi:HEAT repeat protein
MWDTDLRIQALSSLMSSDGARVVPILREIALKAEDEAQARRAIYVLAQSKRADARSTIVEVARTGDEPRQVIAVKVLAYQGWPEAEKVLLDVYGAATPHVKRQVIRVFGNVGSRIQLRRLFETSQDAELKQAIINALFEAGARTELERITKQEKDDEIRRAAAAKLGLMKPEVAK